MDAKNEEFGKSRPAKMTPGAAGKAHRRELMLRYYFQGQSFDQIAKRLKEDTGHTITVQVIQKEVSERLQIMKDSRSEIVLNFKYVELEKINRLEMEYWSAWEASIKPKVLLRETFEAHEQIPGKRASRKKGLGKLKSVIRETSTMTGEPRYILGIQWCVEKRIDLLGLEAPTKNKIADGEGADELKEAAADLGKQESSGRSIKFIRTGTTG